MCVCCVCMWERQRYTHTHAQTHNSTFSYSCPQREVDWFPALVWSWWLNITALLLFWHPTAPGWLRALKAQIHSLVYFWAVPGPCSLWQITTSDPYSMLLSVSGLTLSSLMCGYSWHTLCTDVCVVSLCHAQAEGRALGWQSAGTLWSSAHILCCSAL